MLTPEYLETIGEEIGALYDDVVTDILADIAERIRLAEDTMTATNEYLNQKLIDMGLQQKYINQRLAELQNTTEKKVEEVMASSAYTSVRDSFERYRAAGYDATGVDFSKQILKGTNVLKGELTNLTRTTAKLAQSTFMKSYDKAYLQVTSGAYSYDQACKHVIQDLTKNGIGTIEYYSGAKRTVESAVRLAVRTSVNQNALACEMEMLNDMDDVNLVETSSHVGARPEHAEWQGKVFWLKTPEPGYESFYAATGYGTGTGLGGYNCRHSFYPYLPEFGDQTYNPVDKEENDRIYALEQKQRYHERQMRKWDRTKQIQKAGGQDTKTAIQWKNYHEKQIEEVIKESGILKRDYSAEKGYAPKIDINKLGGHNDWSETTPKVITNKERIDIMSYAKDKGVRVRDLTDFDGDPKLIKESIDSMAYIRGKYPVNSKIQMSITPRILVNDDDFAINYGKGSIVINNKALRDRTITERNMTDKKDYLAARKVGDIIVHEYGHVIAEQIGNVGFDILNKALYNLGRDRVSDVDEAIELIEKEISEYGATYYYSKSQLSNVLLGKKVKNKKPNKLKEVISEAITKNENEPTELTEEFCRILKEEYLSAST